MLVVPQGTDDHDVLLLGQGTCFVKQPTIST